MKPSGPGLLFAGRFLITVLISVLVMGLLRSISFWFSFGKLYFSKNLLVVVSYDPLYFSVVCCDISTFNSNFVNLVLLPLFLNEFC